MEPWIGDLMPALKTAVAPSPSAPTEAQTPDAADPQPPAPAADGLTQAMYGLSLLGHPSTPAAADAPPAAAAAAATATTGAPVKKKKIVIRRAPHKEVPDLAPCPFGLTWAEQDEVRPRHEPAVPASAPAASPLIRAKLAGARYLSTTDAVRPVLEVELHIPAESGLKWTPGDAFAVLCPNPTHEVTQVIDRLALDGKRVFSLRPVSASSTSSSASLSSSCFFTPPIRADSRYHDGRSVAPARQVAVYGPNGAHPFRGPARRAQEELPSRLCRIRLGSQGKGTAV